MSAFEDATLAAAGLPRLPGSPSRRAVPIIPVDRTGARVDSSLSVLPSPFSRRVGIHDFTFETCSGFTHVTARLIAQPPSRPSSRGFNTASRPTMLLVSYQTIDYYLGGFSLHW
jgi:hypothetical protein